MRKASTVLAIILALLVGVMPFYFVQAEEVNTEEQKTSAEAAEVTFTLDGEAFPLHLYKVTFWQPGEEGEEPFDSTWSVVKISELAALLKDTEGRFNYAYDAATQTVNLTPGEAYEPKETDLAELDLENLEGGLVKPTVLVNGNEVDLRGVLELNGELYTRLRQLGSRLRCYRYYADFNDSSKAYFFTDKTDLVEWDEKAFEEQLQKADYTLICNWGPWCYYCRRSMPMMFDLMDRLQKEGKSVQVIGLVNSYQDYRLEELNEAFYKDQPEGKAPWVEFGATEACYDYQIEHYNQDVVHFPFKYFVKKDGNEAFGKEFYTYYDEMMPEYLKSLGLETEEEMTEEQDVAFDELIFSNFLDRALATAKGAQQDYTGLVVDINGDKFQMPMTVLHYLDTRTAELTEKDESVISLEALMELLQMVAPEAQFNLNEETGELTVTK